MTHIIKGIFFWFYFVQKHFGLMVVFSKMSRKIIRWGVGVRVRMRGIFTTKSPLFQPTIYWLWVGPKFSFTFCACRSSASNSLRAEIAKKRQKFRGNGPLTKIFWIGRCGDFCWNLDIQSAVLKIFLTYFEQKGYKSSVNFFEKNWK